MPPNSVEQFIEKWRESGANEESNRQLFLSELCDVLGVDRPDPPPSVQYRDLRKQSVTETALSKSIDGKVEW
jgi:hypothetical protein